MAKPNRDVNVIVDNIISFLACEGFDVRDECRVELAARVNGHADLKAQETYLVKSKQGLVYELGLDDVGGPGSIVQGLKDTLSRPVLGKFDTVREAEIQARELASRLARPIIVLNGMQDIMEVCDETVNGYPYAVYRPLGLLNQGAAFANEEFAEELDLVDAGIKHLRDAVGLASQEAYRNASCEAPNPVVVVEEVENGSRRIMWRSKSLRA